MLLKIQTNLLVCMDDRSATDAPLFDTIKILKGRPFSLGKVDVCERDTPRIKLISRLVSRTNPVCQKALFPCK